MSSQTEQWLGQLIRTRSKEHVEYLAAEFLGSDAEEVTDLPLDEAADALAERILAVARKRGVDLGVLKSEPPKIQESGDIHMNSWKPFVQRLVKVVRDQAPSEDGEAGSVGQHSPVQARRACRSRSTSPHRSRRHERESSSTHIERQLEAIISSIGGIAERVQQLESAKSRATGLEGSHISQACRNRQPRRHSRSKSRSSSSSSSPSSSSTSSSSSSSRSRDPHRKGRRSHHHRRHGRSRSQDSDSDRLHSAKAVVGDLARSELVKAMEQRGTVDEDEAKFLEYKISIVERFTVVESRSASKTAHRRMEKRYDLEFYLRNMREQFEDLSDGKMLAKELNIHLFTLKALLSHDAPRCNDIDPVLRRLYLIRLVIKKETVAADKLYEAWFDDPYGTGMGIDLFDGKIKSLSKTAAIMGKVRQLDKRDKKGGPGAKPGAKP